MSFEALKYASQVDPNTGWRYVRLGDLISLRGGLSYKGEDISEFGNAMVTMGCITPSAPFKLSGLRRYKGTFGTQHVLSVGDLVIATRDVTQNRELIGCPALVPSGLPGDAIIAATNLYKVINHSDTENEFLYWVMKSPAYREQVVASAKGTTVVMLTKDALENFVFPLPPPAERRAICELLSGTDRRISVLRETNATLEAIAQALFKSWFVDFDPVRAKMEGRAPEGMDEATAALFPDGFEESELGLVPMGWSLVPFGQLLCHTIGGDWGSDAPDDKNDVCVAIIRGTDIPDLQSGANSRVPLRYTSQKKLATRKLEDGDIVLEVSGGSKDQPTGRALYLTASLLGQFDCPVEPASFCRLLRPNSKDIGVLLGQHLTYIYAQGKTWEYQNQSTGIANFQTTHFLETELVVVPGADVLAAFAKTIRPMVDRAHLTQIQELANLRDTLLPRLISGQLRLPSTESSVMEPTP